MTKFILSLATLAALSTSALALTNAEFRELERPENKTAYSSGFEGATMNGAVTLEEGFAVVPAGSDEGSFESSYQKQQRFIMRENAQNY